MGGEVNDPHTGAAHLVIVGCWCKPIGAVRVCLFGTVVVLLRLLIILNLKLLKELDVLRIIDPETGAGAARDRLYVCYAWIRAPSSSR